MSIVHKLRHGLAMAGWATPRVLSVGCLVALVLAASQYMSTQDDHYPFRSSHSALCGDRSHIPGGASLFDRDLVTVEIRDSGVDQFVLSGSIQISRQSRQNQLVGVEKMMLELVPMSTGRPVDLGISSFIEIPFKPGSDTDASHALTVKLPDRKLTFYGDVQRFPFDNYWMGFEPRLLVLRHGKSMYEPYPLDAVLTDANMTNAFDVIRATKEDLYLTASDKDASEALQYDAVSRQCGFRVSRSPWYKSMVVCLVMLVLAPAVFAIYKLESDPGLGLISAVIGVASIRAFLLGASENWHFYRIDFVFAAAVVLVAAIPLWRQSSADGRRQILRATRTARRRRSSSRS